MLNRRTQLLEAGSVKVSKTQDIFRLLVTVAVCQFAGVVGSIFTIPAIPTWYASLSKPSFNPPSWVFAPVWVTLFTLMGMSLFTVWRKGFSRPENKRAMGLFGIQLVLNVLWSVAFFGTHSPLYGFVVIVALWVAVLATMILFYRITKVAALLLLPYLLWGTFASILNFSILLLNP